MKNIYVKKYRENLTGIGLLKRRRGAALAYAIIILLVISVFAVSVMMISSMNFAQIDYQKNYTETYYLAYSGVQMAFSSLLADGDQGANDLFNKLKNGTISPLTESGIKYGNGSIDIEAKRVDDASSVYHGWIVITSTGTLTKNGFTLTRTLFVNPDDQKDVIWKDG